MKESARKRTRRPVKQPRQGLPAYIWVGAISALVLGILVFQAWNSAQTPKVPVETAGAPKLKVDQEQKDLGNVHLGQTVEVSFQLADVGDQPLRFAKEPYVEVVEGC